MYISIIGTSSITKQHIEVLRKNFKILSISATRGNSKNLRKISKKYKIKNSVAMTVGEVATPHDFDICKNIDIIHIIIFFLDLRGFNPLLILFI